MHSPPRQGPPPPLGSLRHMRYREFYVLQPESVRHARHDFRAAAMRSELDVELEESVELCLSELAGNAVRHAKDPRPRRHFHVEFLVGGMRRRVLELRVHDFDSKHLPVMPDPAAEVDPLDLLDLDYESGRGLLLVAMHADSLGVSTGPGLNGKVVWCRWYLDRRAAGAPPPRDPREAWGLPTPRP